MLLGFFFTWILLVLYSFTLQDLNLTLYNFSFWNPLRQSLQALAIAHRPLIAIIFLVLVSWLVVLYLRFISLHRHLQPNSNHLVWALLLIFTGLVAYPMLSHDIFNYLFNAKMVLVYRVNPYLQTASQFLFDPWIRFMHNIHTPAPYAYGWTVISLLPGLISLTGKFTLSFWAMKLFIGFFWLGQLLVLYYLVKRLYPQQIWRWWLFALSPLVLIETLIVGHNDVVMMAPALLGFWFLLKSKKLFDKYFLFAFFSLLFSLSIKYATIVLLPLLLIKVRWKQFDFPSVAAILLLVVMFSRPDQFHSWYLIWAFSFVVLSNRRWLISLFTALTIGALLRYAPYIYYGYWDPPVYLLRNLIWLLSLILTPFILKNIFSNRHGSNTTIVAPDPRL
jgi:hypothetical protein